MELSLAFIGWFFALTSAGALVLGAALIAMLANAGDLQRRYLSYSIWNDLVLAAIWVLGLAGGIGWLATRSGNKALHDPRLVAEKIGRSAFVADLAHEGILRPGADHVQTADSCWAPTGPRLFTELIIGRGWDADTYQQWLADMLAATLLNAR